ncbi:MAG: glycosyltransferase [Gemmatimonadaceae bacterium]
MHRRDDRVACAFVGLIDTAGRVAQNPAFSAAGTQFQESLLGSLRTTAVDVTHVYALRPVPSFPTYQQLGFSVGRTTLLGSLRTTLLPFVNVGPLKTITSGIALFPYLLMWAWRERRRRRVFLLYNLYSPPGIVAIVAGWLSRTRVVAIVADIQVPGHGLLPDTPLRQLDYQLQVKTLPLFDGLVVLTRTMAREFAPGTPFIEMEGAVPDALMRSASTTDVASDASTRPFVVMYAGGLSDLKGIPLLLASFALLEGNGYALWVTGRGPLEEAVRDAAARDPRITYWGFPEQDELLVLYGRADALVNPHSASHASARYLFPSKLIEYLATGTPVVSTCSTPEVAEIYGDYSLVVPADTPGEIATSVRRLASMSSSQRQALGARARSFVLAEKTWRKQAQRISEFITFLLSDRERGTPQHT